MFRSSSNPVITRVQNERREIGSFAYVSDSATFSGIATKTGILLLIIVAISAFIWRNHVSLIESGALIPLLIFSSIGGFIFILLAHYTQAKGLFTCLYAVGEGILIGTLTLFVQQSFPETPIVLNAAIITFTIVGFLLVAYSTGLFKVGFRFRKIVYTILFTLFFAMLITSIMQIFTGINLFYTASPEVMLAMTVGFIVLASFVLLIDFDDCRRAVEMNLPKKYEWVLSLGILVSIVWLFVEVLRLLMIVASRARD